MKIKKNRKAKFYRWWLLSFRLIKSTDLSISIPFTSTALIGKHMNKPSCFYDPLNILDKDDRASQNLEVVKGKKNLQMWVSQYV